MRSPALLINYIIFAVQYLHYSFGYILHLTPMGGKIVRAYSL